MAARTRVRQLRRDLQQVNDEPIEREADLPTTFVKYIRESIKVLQMWRDSKQLSRKQCHQFNKRAFTYGIDKGSEKTLHEVGLRLNEVLIREGHEVLQGKYNYFL